MGGPKLHFCSKNTALCKNKVCLAGHSLPPHGLQDTQYVQKQINKIKIEVDGSENILFGRQLVHDEVGVEYNEPAEDDGTSD